MSENEMNNLPVEDNHVPVEEQNDKMTDVYMGPTQPSTDIYDDEKPQDGFTFNWTNLLFGVAIVLWWSLGNNGFATDWFFYLYLAIVIIIHELGHVVIGKSFGCHVKGMQVFFLPFVNYKPKHDPLGSSWRNITWSLGVLPLGGLTMFRSRELEEEEKKQWYYQEQDNVPEEYTVAASPYIDDKPAWQRLLISAAGVLFNFATFFIIYLALPYMPTEYYDICWPLVVLSLLLAVLNFLPVYPLDGGSVLFALYEMITDKKPSQGFTKVCTTIGIIFIVLFFWIFPDWLNGILGSVFRVFF